MCSVKASETDWPEFIHTVFPYHADASDASPVRLLVHSGRLVDLAEEEVDLLLELLGRRDDGGTSKLRVW